MPVYDLHCHSTHSDGSLSVSELLHRACEQEVDVLAITDHDCVDGLPEANSLIAQESLPIKLINGVEISCRWHSFEIHIVGLNIDPEEGQLKALLNEQQQRRYDRFDAMLEKLYQRGVSLSAEDCQADGMPTRKHIADAMVRKGTVSKPQQAFDRYIGKGSSAYVNPEWCDIPEAIDAIHSAGGKAVLAHPHGYKMSNKWLRKLLLEGKEWGLDAMEVSLCQQSPGHRDALAKMSREYGLLASQGSDFHYPGNWRELGKNLCLPADCVPIWEHWSQ
ncbi:PHP domain-containing protein [Idiomarina abyssalis]|uniref:PHP domain-containing protein n=1 Tax=Idiomarina abyssalis TaxID=86102 RepID=UPI0022FFC6CD|nr:PHP domain-containing protein [Idiomarina abyssalis]MDA6065653.1 PHP domain-containing protein [Idiomarina abyssalis]